MVQDIDTRLSMPGLSPGKRQALIKDKTLKIGKVKSLAKRIEDLANGNALIGIDGRLMNTPAGSFQITVTITFENKDSGERYRIVYTNISQDDAVAHLKLMANLQGMEIIISEVKEVQTKNSLTKL